MFQTDKILSTLPIAALLWVQPSFGEASTEQMSLFTDSSISSEQTSITARASCRNLFVVTRQDDRNLECQPNNCALREAVKAANQCPGVNTIELGRGVYDLEFYAHLEIKEAVRIEGAGMGQTRIRRISQSEFDRNIFTVLYDADGDHNKASRITGVTLDGGRSPGSGGGIFMGQNSFVVLIDVGIRNSNAADKGGAIHVGHGSIFYYINGLLLNNRAASIGGGIHALNSALFISNVKFISNYAAAGGGLYANRSRPLEQPRYELIISNSEFSRNRAIGSRRYNAQGGAIVTIGQKLRLGEVQIDRNDGGNLAGGLLLSGGSADIRNVTIHDNRADRAGGLYSRGMLNLSHSTLSNNVASLRQAGGAFLFGEYLLTDITVSDNRAPNNGDIIASTGCGLLLAGQGAIRRSLIYRNQADEGGGVATYRGFVVGEPEDNTTFVNTLTNVTVSENQAQRGGGIFNHIGDLALNNVSVIDNQAELGAAIYTSSSFPIILNELAFPLTRLSHSIVANRGTGNPPNLCYDRHHVATDGLEFGFLSENHNLFGDANCMQMGANDIVAVDPLLEPLDDYGGKTRSYRPLATSPAIDGGSMDTVDPGLAGCSREDQRGLARPQANIGNLAICDIGSIELSEPKN